MHNNMNKTLIIKQIIREELKKIALTETSSELTKLINLIHETLTKKYSILKPKVEVFKPGIIQVMFNRPLRPSYQKYIVDDVKDVLPSEYSVRFSLGGATDGNLVIHHDIK